MCTIMKCKKCNILICPNYDRLCTNCKIQQKEIKYLKEEINFKTD